MKTYRSVSKSLFFLMFSFLFIPGLFSETGFQFVIQLIVVLMFLGGTVLGLCTRITFYEDYFDTTIKSRVILFDCTNQTEVKQHFKYIEIKKVTFVDIDKRFALKREAIIELHNNDQYIFPVHLFSFSQGQQIKAHLNKVK